MIKNALIFKFYFLQKDHSTEQTPVMRMFPSDIHFSAELTEAMVIKCHAHGHSMPAQPVFAVTRNQHLTHMTNMLLLKLAYYGDALSILR